MPTIEPPGRRPVSPQEAADINETGDELFEGQQAEGPVKPVEPHKQIPAARNPQLQHTPPNLHARSAAPTAAQQIPSSPEIREKYKQDVSLCFSSGIYARNAGPKRHTGAI